MDRWSNQDSDEQRFANGCFDESAREVVAKSTFLFRQALSVKNYLDSQVMVLIR